ncbi:hypothetical protein L204_103544 [Cryptococcus depauperatus]|nr:methylene-fatty-acyl-phospholipid synthase [Cryptococcus depauperatus CBS 7841]ODO01132.1 methylene-fatty-acyl-phospholipid synthase [Cryptococcus depauperatus CBS 7855]
MAKLPLDIPSWIPGSDLFNPQHRYTTRPLPTSLHEALSLVELKSSLFAFIAMTAFNPIFWNFVARNEYRNKTITKVVGSPLVGCYLLAVTIFSISAFRDHLFINAVQDQPALAILGEPAPKAIAVILFTVGQTFVISSMWALGVTGTYLGDYFGILMTHRVTCFPFNVLSDPMYVGSFMTHLGTALWYQSPVGVSLAGWVWVVYWVALKFEGPFTDRIYSGQSKKTDSSSVPTSTASAIPATPSRRSGRLASKAASVPSSDVDSDSDQLYTVPTPRRSGRKSALRDEVGKSTPRRVTRSRSKGRTSEVSGDE